MSVLYTTDLYLHCDSKSSPNCINEKTITGRSSRGDAKSTAMKSGWHVGAKHAVCPNCFGYAGDKDR